MQNEFITITEDGVEASLNNGITMLAYDKGRTYAVPVWLAGALKARGQARTATREEVVREMAGGVIDVAIPVDDIGNTDTVKDDEGEQGGATENESDGQGGEPLPEPEPEAEPVLAPIPAPEPETAEDRKTRPGNTKPIRGPIKL